MPRRDGTGSNGMGAMTGRRAGYGCQRGYRRQFLQTGIPGYLRNGYPQKIQDSEEKAFLEMQETRLENQLKSVKKRLSNLNNAASQ